MKVPMIVISHAQLGDTGRKTDFWLEEMPAPYYVVRDAGAHITLAAPKGGRAPLDPKINEQGFPTDLAHRFEKEPDAEASLGSKVRPDSVAREDYEIVFHPGGHGPTRDLADDENSIMLLKCFQAAGKTIAVVCLSTCALFPRNDHWAGGGTSPVIGRGRKQNPMRNYHSQLSRLNVLSLQGKNGEHLSTCKQRAMHPFRIGERR